MLKFKKALVLLISTIFASFLFCEEIILNQNNQDFSKTTALQLLEVSTGHTQKNTKELFSKYGFTTLLQKNYSKGKNQIDNTSAFTIGKGKVVRGEKSVNAYLIVVRGTDGNEWYSNFNVSSSASNQTHFVEPFLYSANEIFLEATKIITDKNAVIIVCGHSRGGAVSNLLGLLFNEVYNSKNVYAYTFATPSTIRNLNNLNDKNIFNMINPEDVVPYLPPVQWGFKRAGTDIILETRDRTLEENLKSTFSNMCDEVSDVNSFYNKKLDLNQFGFEGGNLTAYEAMMIIGTEFSKLTAEDFDLSEFENMDDINLENLGLLKEHMPSTYKSKIQNLK